MKKLVFLLIPLLITLGACNNSSSNASISNQDEVDNLKALLNKVDLSDFHKKSLGTMFTQEYDVLDVYKDGDEEKTTSFFSYIGLGFLDMMYDLSKDEYDSIVDEKGNINVFDAISVGDGGYRITQSSKATSFFRDGGDYATTQNLNINQQMTVRSLDNDVFIYNSLDVTDKDYFDYSDRQYFNGTIKKDLLFDSISTRSFSEIFSKVHLFDAPGNVEYLDRLYFEKCRELKDMSDKEISDFINENQIKINEGEENIELDFVFKNEDIDEEYESNIFPGEIVGKLMYDKTTSEFKEFEYEIKFLRETYDEETGSSKYVIMAFKCSGASKREGMGDMYTPNDPTVYDDVVSFLEDVNEQVVPPSIFD